MIWTNEYLARLALEAEEDIATQVPCIIDRYSLATTKFVPEYKLPDYVQNIRRVFWRGVRLDSIPYLFDPWNYSVDEPDSFIAGAFYNKAFSRAFHIGGSSSNSSNKNGARATGYFYAKYGENVIRFDPGVDETIDVYNDGLYDTNIGNAVIIEFYRMPDGAQFKVPEYIRRRTIKAYVLWKAFAKEGNGQDLQASQYWSGRYLILLKRAISILQNINSAVIYNRDGGEIYGDKPPRPVLPANYGIVMDDYD